jgi:hypothetical protein
MKQPKREGEIAQIGFVYKAMTVGLTVLEPYGDSERYDYVLNRGRNFWRIQVRSTRTLSRPNVYSVASTFKVNHGRGAAQRLPYTDKEIHFLAVVIVPEDTLYLIPVAALRGRGCLYLNSRNHPKPCPEAQYKNAWHPFFD